MLTLVNWKDFMDIKYWVFVLTLGAVSCISAEQDYKLVETLCDQGIFVETVRPGVTMSGFVDAGYTHNFNGAGTTAFGRPAAPDNTARSDFNLNAFRLALEQPLPGVNEFAAGFRADLVYGEDANFYDGESNGNGGVASDFSLIQAYVQFRAPVGNGLDFRVGRFAGLIGYESSERAANINITYGNIVSVSSGYPVGSVASYVINKQLDVQFALINNYVGSDGLGANGTSDELTLTGSVNVQSQAKNANIYTAFELSPWGNSGITLTGNNAQAPNAAPENEFAWILNNWGAWQPLYAKEKLLLAYELSAGSFRYQNDFTVEPISQNSENWFGFALYTKYQFTDIFSLAGRGDYLKATDGQIFATSSPDSIGNELFSTTLTAGFDLAADTLLRVEYRADWGADAVTTTDDLGGPAPQSGPSHLVAAQIVYTF
jgi:hypothetical protein